MACAFLVKKGGQQVLVVKSKAKGRARGRAPTNEGAVTASDVSPPRLPPARPLIAYCTALEWNGMECHVMSCDVM